MSVRKSRLNRKFVIARSVPADVSEYCWPSVAPGPTETEGAGAALWPTEDDRARVLGSVPAARFTTPEEVAESAAFLLDEARAGYVTGDVLTVDGGQWLGKPVYADSRG